MRVSGGVCGGSDGCNTLLIDDSTDFDADGRAIADTDDGTNDDSTDDSTDAHANGGSMQ